MKSKEAILLSTDYISMIAIKVKCKWFFLTKRLLRMSTINSPTELKRTCL